MFTYYLLLSLGCLLFIGAILAVIYMYIKREFTFLSVLKLMCAFILGALILWITLPSLKLIISKDFEVVEGECTIDVSSSRKGGTDTTFTMKNTDEIYIFDRSIEVDAYGKAIPYYCEITTTKDHMWEIDYKLYDIKTHKLLSRYRE